MTQKNRTLKRNTMKPCPFCGESRYIKLDTNGHQTWVICCNCGAISGRVWNCKAATEQAVEIWNTRRVGNWIPITEQKPPTAVHVLVTLYWEDDDWYEVCELDYGVLKADGNNIINNVIAWMPMPEPYKEAKAYDT